MFVRLFYSSISFMQIQIVENCRFARYAVVRERRRSLEIGMFMVGRIARHLETLRVFSGFHRLVIFAWWSHPFPSRTRK